MIEVSFRAHISISHKNTIYTQKCQYLGLQIIALRSIFPDPVTYAVKPTKIQEMNFHTGPTLKSVGMTLAKVKEQDGMTLAKVKEQDGMTLAKVRHAQVSHAPR